MVLPWGLTSGGGPWPPWVPRMFQTPDENTWDFGAWKADTLVINLGTNGHLGGEAAIAQYNQTYKALVVAAAKAYGTNTHFSWRAAPCRILTAMR